MKRKEKEKKQRGWRNKLQGIRKEKNEWGKSEEEVKNKIKGCRRDGRKRKEGYKD